MDKILFILAVVIVCTMSFFNSALSQRLSFEYPSLMPPPFDRPEEYPDPIDQLKTWAAHGDTSAFSENFFTFKLDKDKNILYVTVPIAISYFDHDKDSFRPESEAPRRFSAEKVKKMLTDIYNFNARKMGVEFIFDIQWAENPSDEFHYKKYPQERFNVLLSKPDDPIWRHVGSYFTWNQLITGKQKAYPRAHATMNSPKEYNSYCEKVDPGPRIQAFLDKQIELAKTDDSIKIVSIPPISEKLCEFSAWSLILTNDPIGVFAHESIHFVFGNTDSYGLIDGRPLPALRSFLSSKSVGAVQPVEILTFLLKRGYMPPAWDRYVEGEKPKNNNFYKKLTRAED